MEIFLQCWMFIIGACIGSFAFCLFERWSNGQSILTESSHCSQCSTPLQFWQNLPILGWILVRGKCSHCGVKIPVQYVLVELCFGLIAWSIFTDRWLPSNPIPQILRSGRFSIGYIFWQIVLYEPTLECLLLIIDLFMITLAVMFCSRTTGPFSSHSIKRFTFYFSSYVLLNYIINIWQFLSPTQIRPDNSTTMLVVAAIMSLAFMAWIVICTYWKLKPMKSSIMPKETSFLLASIAVLLACRFDYRILIGVYMLAIALHSVHLILRRDFENTVGRFLIYLCGSIWIHYLAEQLIFSSYWPGFSIDPILLSGYASLILVLPFAWIFVPSASDRQNIPAEHSIEE